jgi:hypothetical protein
MRQPFTVMLSVVRENVLPVTKNCLGVTVATVGCPLVQTSIERPRFPLSVIVSALGPDLAVARLIDQNVHIGRKIDYSRRLLRRARDVFNSSRRLAGNRVIRTARQLLNLPKFHPKLSEKFFSASIVF